jgi:hydroxyacid-oxoacid transhydrogenase
LNLAPAIKYTTVANFDLLEMGIKTGISNPYLRLTLGVLNPNTLTTIPEEVLAANGFDVFPHACEFYAATPYTDQATGLLGCQSL